MKRMHREVVVAIIVSGVVFHIVPLCLKEWTTLSLPPNTAQ